MPDDGDRSSSAPSGQSHRKTGCGDDGYELTESKMLVVEPRLGQKKVGPIKPDFCDQVPLPEQDGCPSPGAEAGVLKRTLTTAIRNGFSPRQVRMMLQAVCKFPDNQGFNEATGYLVQAWSNEYGQEPDEALASMVLRADEEKWTRQVEDGCKQMPEPSAEASKQEQLVQAARRAMVGCGRTAADAKDLAWYIDRTPEPESELARIYYAQACMGAPASTDKRLLKIPLCGLDIEAIDMQDIDEETAGMPEPLRAQAREKAGALKVDLQELEREVAPRVEADPELQMLLHEAPAAGWQSWVVSYEKNRASMEAAFKFEDALFGPSKKAYAGCAEWLEPELREFVKRQNIQNREKFLEVMSEPSGYTLMNALATCYAVTSPAEVGVFLLETTEKSRKWRGPRSAARYAMIDALNEIKASRDRFPIEYSWIDLGYTNPVVEAARGERSNFDSSKQLVEEVKGVVRSTSKVPGQKSTKLSFKPETWMEKTSQCRSTGEVSHILPSGEILYRQKCRYTGTQKRTFQPKDILVEDWAAKGVRPDAFVVVAAPGGSQGTWAAKSPPLGHPVEIHRDKKKSKLINLYGFAL